MGSFFSGSRTGSIGGSSGNNAVMNDPIHKFLFGAQPENLPTAGPYAGVAPTLAAAKGGYATANGQAAPLTGVSPQLAGLGSELAPAPQQAAPAAALPLAQRPLMGNPMQRPAVGGSGGIYGY